MPVFGVKFVLGKSLKYMYVYVGLYIVKCNELFCLAGIHQYGRIV